jgi:F-type H+-transporting ATPase subunit c
MELAPILYYLSICFVVMAGTSGIALGQGYMAGRSIAALGRQMLAQGPVRRSLFIGLTLLESGCVFSLIVGVMALFGPPVTFDLAPTAAIAASMCALGVVAGVVGLASGRMLAAAFDAMARQPLMASSLFGAMLLAQVLLEAPALLAFIFCFLTRSFVLADGCSVMDAVQALFAALIFGGIAIGPAIGQSMFSTALCEALGRAPDLRQKLFSFMFIVQAIIETPVVLGIIGAFMLLKRGLFVAPLYEVLLVMIGVVCTVTFGAAGASIGSGRVAGTAARCMADSPAQYSTLFQISLLSQTIIDTALIYSLIVCALLIKQCV